VRCNKNIAKNSFALEHKTDSSFKIKLMLKIDDFLLACHFYLIGLGQSEYLKKLKRLGGIVEQRFHDKNIVFLFSVGMMISFFCNIVKTWRLSGNVEQ